MKTIFIFFFVSMLLISNISSFAQNTIFKHPGGLHSILQLEKARERISTHKQPWKSAYDELLKAAQKSLNRIAQPVSNFDVPGYYVNPVQHENALQKLSYDAWGAYSCAVVYQLNNSSDRFTYAKKTIHFLTAWSITNNKVSNSDGNLVMVYAGIGLIYAAELISDYDAWPNESRKQFKNWIQNVFLNACNLIVQRKNNWGDWGLLGRFAAHHFLNDQKNLDTDIDVLKSKIEEAISYDGSMPLEIVRGRNSMWYTYFALAPLTAACQIAYNARGINLFNYKGGDKAGLREAFNYLSKYAQTPEKWPHYINDDINLPSPYNWPGNLFEAMNEIYENKNILKWIETARPIMFYGHHYAWTLPTLLPASLY